MSDTNSLMGKKDDAAFPTAVVEVDPAACEAAQQQQHFFHSSRGQNHKNHKNPKSTTSKLRKVVYYYDSSSSGTDDDDDDDDDDEGETLGVLVTTPRGEKANHPTRTDKTKNKNKNTYGSPREPHDGDENDDDDDDVYSKDAGGRARPLLELRNPKNDKTKKRRASARLPAVITIRKEKGDDVSPQNPRIGSPTPIGYFAFGLTTALFNVHNAKICPLNTATMGQVIFFGGLTQFLCGFFELINKNTFGCTISTTYGAFWLATAALDMIDVAGNNGTMVMGGHTYSGGFFLFWFFFAGTLCACSLFAPLMCSLLMLLVPVNFLLQSIAYFADSRTVMQVAGYEGIVVGCLAFYLGMAFTFEDVYHRRILPLFSHDRRYRNWRW